MVKILNQIKKQFKQPMYRAFQWYKRPLFKVDFLIRNMWIKI